MKKLIKLILSPVILFSGLIYYFFTKKNKNTFHQSLVIMYCLTSGFVCTLINLIIRTSSIKLENKKVNKNVIPSGILQLKQEGYLILNDKIDKDTLNELNLFAKKNLCHYEQVKNSEQKLFENHEKRYPTYSYLEEDLINNESVLKLVTNKEFINIAKSYLGSYPLLSGLNMWWSTNYLKKPDEQAAQMYHFDLDRVKWLKFFIYLTDVDLTNGPHVYVSGTHKPFSKPYKFLSKGYKRISDQEIQNYYGKERIKTITGNSGTLIIGDTNCYHKGLHPIDKNRLVFEFEYASSYFGGVDTKKINKKTKVLHYYNTYPELFKKYKHQFS